MREQHDRKKARTFSPPLWVGFKEFIEKKHLQDPFANKDRKSYKETKRLERPLTTPGFFLLLSLIPLSLNLENSRKAALSDEHPSMQKQCCFMELWVECTGAITWDDF